MDKETNTRFDQAERLTLIDKFQNLLPGIEFEEPHELREARVAVLEALTRKDIDPNVVRSVWVEYAKTCEQIVDERIRSSPKIRAQLQIAMLVYKALIFREIGDMQRYVEDLSDAEVYAYSVHLNEVGETITAELDGIS